MCSFLFTHETHCYVIQCRFFKTVFNANVNAKEGFLQIINTIVDLIYNDKLFQIIILIYNKSSIVVVIGIFDSRQLEFVSGSESQTIVSFKDIKVGKTNKGLIHQSATPKGFKFNILNRPLSNPNSLEYSSESSSNSSCLLLMPCTCVNLMFFYV